jgi:AcrR family transcriptional regulator
MEAIMDDRKLKIIEAGKKSFSLFGYKGSTVDQIAKIAGVGKGSVYLFFETKEEILGAIVDLLVQEMTLQVERSFKETDGLTERMHKAIYGCLLFRKEQSILIKLTQEVAQYGTEAAQNALNQIEGRIIEFIRGRLEKAEASGMIKIPNKELSAFVLYRLYAALLIDWEKENAPLPNEVVFEMLKKLILP